MLNISLIKINNLSFKAAPPPNYRKIDEFVSRSAQPLEDNFLWLKEQGVTDILNFRTMYVSGIDFNEEKKVAALGMRYHNIPVTETILNSGDNTKVLPLVNTFFRLIKDIKTHGEKLHIHCKAGADRTGFFALLYKTHNGLDTFEQATKELLEMGHHKDRYPDMANFAIKIAQKIRNDVV